MTPEYWKKLDEICQNNNVEKVSKCVDRSDTLRSLIDKLHYRHVVCDTSKVSIHSPKCITRTPDTRKCPNGLGVVSVANFCSKCHDKTPKTWANCPALLAEQGIQKPTALSSGKPFKGAIR